MAKALGVTSDAPPVAEVSVVSTRDLLYTRVADGKGPTVYLLRVYLGRVLFLSLVILVKCRSSSAVYLGERMGFTVVPIQIP